jgi:hypothetical protein
MEPRTQDTPDEEVQPELVFIIDFVEMETRLLERTKALAQDIEQRCALALQMWTEQCERPQVQPCNRSDRPKDGADEDGDATE